MGKEKEIEELYDEIYADIAIQFGAGDYIEGDDREVLAKQIVEHLQELGYRKADEVRKETAKKIADWLEDGCFQAGLDASVFFIAKLIRVSYGIEVDE